MQIIDRLSFPVILMHILYSVDNILEGMKMNKQSKRLLSIFLALMVAVGMFAAIPATVSAAGTITYDSAGDLFDYMKNYKGYAVTLSESTITLQQDINLDKNFALIFSSATGDDLEVTLDLNGKKLSGETDLFYVVGVKKGILTITDSSTNGTGVIENIGSDSIALNVENTGILNVKGGTTKAQFGLLQGGGKSFLSGGEVSGVIIGVLMTDGTCNINGGMINGGGHGISASGGTLTFGDKFKVAGTYWDGVHVENIDVIFQDVIDGVITGGKYGVSATNGSIVFETIQKCQISGQVAAVMLEAKNNINYGMYLMGTSVNAGVGKIVTTTFNGRTNPVCTSFSTADNLTLTSWADRYAAPVTLPSGAKVITLSNAELSSVWAREDVKRATELKLVPNELNKAYGQQTTRAEFCALAVKLYETIKGVEIAERMTFVDTDDINVEKMGALNVVNGVSNDRFDPEATLTREQAAAMLSRLANVIGKPLPKRVGTFTDMNTVFAYAIEAVGQVQAADIMRGVGNNTFAPRDPYTREQSIMTMLRLYDFVK